MSTACSPPPTSRTHAVVIGGGLLGLEAAHGLMLRGMKVTVIHLMPTLMERQLDGASGMLRKSLEGRGMMFLMPAQTAGDPRRRTTSTGVRFKDGAEFRPISW